MVRVPGMARTRKWRGMLNCRQIEDFIDDYLDESMAWRKRALFRSHLLMCRECRSYIDAYKRAVALGKNVFSDGDGPPPEDVPEELVKAILDARSSGVK